MRRPKRWACATIAAVPRWLSLILWTGVCAGLLVPAFAGAAERPPQLRLTVGERSAEAFQVGYCRPTADGGGMCATAALAAGVRFPALAAEPQARVVIDAGLPAKAVEVTLSPLDADHGERREATVTRIDDRHWAFSMGSTTARASFSVEYAAGGSSDSLLVLRRIIAESPGAGSLAAYGDVAAWSERAGEAYRLVALVDGRVRRLPVASRPVPFDVDLGPAEDDRPVAVYSRCKNEAAAAGPRATLTHPYTSGRGCDLHRYDFDTRRETKVAGASTAQASEMLPSIWRDQIAFARVYERRAGARGLVPYLYVRPLAGGRSERQPGGARGRDGLPGPTSIDLYGRRLSFAWNYATGDHSGITELRLDTLGGGHRVLSRARYPGLDDAGTYASFLSPQGVDGRILYGYQRIRRDTEAFAVPRPDGGHTDAVQTTTGSVTSLLLRYRITRRDKNLDDVPHQTAGLAALASDRLLLAQRDDLLAGKRATTTIVDARDLR